MNIGLQSFSPSPKVWSLLVSRVSMGLAVDKKMNWQKRMVTTHTRCHRKSQDNTQLRKLATGCEERWSVENR